MFLITVSASARDIVLVQLNDLISESTHSWCHQIASQTSIHYRTAVENEKSTGMGMLNMC